MGSSFESEGMRIGQLVAKKNKAYGNSFNKCNDLLNIIFPKGIPSDRIRYASYFVRVLDKMNRIANDAGAFDENPFEDIVGYSLLACQQWAEDNNLPFGKRITGAKEKAIDPSKLLEELAKHKVDEFQNTRSVRHFRYEVKDGVDAGAMYYMVVDFITGAVGVARKTPNNPDWRVVGWAFAHTRLKNSLGIITDPDMVGTVSKKSYIITFPKIQDEEVSAKMTMCVFDMLKDAYITMRNREGFKELDAKHIYVAER